MKNPPEVPLQVLVDLLMRKEARARCKAERRMNRMLARTVGHPRGTTYGWQLVSGRPNVRPSWAAFSTGRTKDVAFTVVRSGHLILLIGVEFHFYFDYDLTWGNEVLSYLYEHLPSSACSESCDHGRRKVFSRAQFVEAVSQLVA